MKKLFALLLTLVLMLALCSCSATMISSDTWGTANMTKTDGDVRYQNGYYADMYHKFQRLDLFAQDKFDYTVRVTENDGYAAYGDTSWLTSGDQAEADIANYEPVYYNYLSNTSYTYTFLSVPQCEDVLFAYMDMLVKEGYYEVTDYTVVDNEGNAVEMYFQSPDMSERADYMILRSDVGSNQITVGFAPWYDGQYPSFQSDVTMDNELIHGETSPMTYVLTIVLCVLGGAAVIFVVLVVGKRLLAKKKQD